MLSFGCSNVKYTTLFTSKLVRSVVSLLSHQFRGKGTNDPVSERTSGLMPAQLVDRMYESRAIMLYVDRSKKNARKNVTQLKNYIPKGVSEMETTPRQLEPATHNNHNNT